MRHGSLFSGIGGFDLAAEWMGWQNVFHCEWNSFGQRILKYYCPNAISYNDITKTNFNVHRGSIDIVTGGFPCQPYSTAGKRLGKADERHLWPEMLRAIREIRPRWVVGENVLGLVNWSDGLVFEEVCSALEAEGYEVQPFILPAASVNAPHRRDRVWFVAHARNNGDTRDAGEVSRAATQTDGGWKESSPTSRRQVQLPDESSTLLGDAAQNTVRDGCLRGEPIEEGAEVWEQRHLGARDTERIRGEKMAGFASNTESQRAWEQSQQNRYWTDRRFDNNGEISNASDTCNEGLQRRQFNKTFEKERQKRWQQSPRSITEPHKISNWQQFPTVSPLCDGDDGLSGRLDGISFSKWRNESIKGGGNAVVPQVVLQIFKAIDAYERTNN